MKTTIKEHYSNTINERDQRSEIICRHCKGVYKLIDTLLEIPENKDHDINDITTYCPLCNLASPLKNDYTIN